jgi:prepilin-type N-terminal cleavage/methylation domain-containing protein
MLKALFSSRRSAFTLIEVIISVMIISIVVLAVIEISSRSRDSAIYLSKRNMISFQDSYFLNSKITSYHKDTKNAYDMLSPMFMITEHKSKEILKGISRDITIPDPIKVPSLGDSGPSAKIEKVILKDQYSSTYFRFGISSF